MNANAPPPPAAPAPPSRPIPWEDTDRSSAFERFFETVKGLASAPGPTFRSMPRTGGLAQPILYAVLVGWIGIAIGLFWSVLMQGMWMPFMDLGDEMGFAMGMSVVSTIGMAVIAPLFVIIGIFIGAAILHLMLLIVGGANHGFETTVRVVCYAQTAQLANIIPMCGGLISVVWALVLYIVGIAEGQQTGHGKAALAVLLPGILCCAFMAMMFFVLMGVIAAQAQ